MTQTSNVINCAHVCILSLTLVCMHIPATPWSASADPPKAALSAPDHSETPSTIQNPLWLWQLLRPKEAMYSETAGRRRMTSTTDQQPTANRWSKKNSMHITSRCQRIHFHSTKPDKHILYLLQFQLLPTARPDSSPSYSRDSVLTQSRIKYDNQRIERNEHSTNWALHFAIYCAHPLNLLKVTDMLESRRWHKILLCMLIIALSNGCVQTYMPWYSLPIVYT